MQSDYSTAIPRRGTMYTVCHPVQEPSRWASRARVDVIVVAPSGSAREALKRAVESDGLRVALSVPPEEMESAIGCQRGVVVIDVGRAGRRDFNALHTLRAAGLRAPVLVVADSADEADVVYALSEGADDYVARPYGVSLMSARVRALARRAARGTAEIAREVLRVGEIEVDVPGRLVARRGVEVKLRPMEFDLFVTLARHPGTVLSRRTLLTDVWRAADDITTRTVDAHILELRRKLEDVPSSPRHIITVPKRGYRLDL